MATSPKVNTRTKGHGVVLVWEGDDCRVTAHRVDNPIIYTATPHMQKIMIHIKTPEGWAPLDRGNMAHINRVLDSLARVLASQKIGQTDTESQHT